MYDYCCIFNEWEGWLFDLKVNVSIIFSRFLFCSEFIVVSGQFFLFCGPEKLVLDDCWEGFIGPTKNCFLFILRNLKWSSLPIFHPPAHLHNFRFTLIDCIQAYNLHAMHNRIFNNMSIEIVHVWNLSGSIVCIQIAVLFFA